ncbi:hypothetical protein BJ508DRAFT_323778 [Ascobolus immersus RN42]|uniref:Copper-fist domain-containing protein n=1 Tax=Ascobolus immersus RN42 TaxID=1160509 RepID=A0A3N4IDC7_ASCIM|nr:hypothetical protein BJ508DRAFT_323778 [Ascobolus immersus RN42]
MLVEGNKFACDACIRGHRVTGCEHVDRQLTQIAKKGRPVSQCSSCRQSRKSRGTHNKCECGTKEPNTIPAGGLIQQGKEWVIGPGINVCLCMESKNYVCKCCQRQREQTLDTVPEGNESGVLNPPLAPHSFISRPRALVPTMSETSLHSLGAQYGKMRPLHARHAHQYSVPYSIPANTSSDRLNIGLSRRIRSEHSSPTLDPVSNTWAGDMPPLDLLSSTVEQRSHGISIAPAMNSARPTPRQTPLHSPLNTPISAVHSSVLTADSLQKPVSTLGAVIEEPIYESSADTNMLGSVFHRPSVAAMSGDASGLLNATRVAHSRSLQPLSVNTAQAQYNDFSGEGYLTSAPPSATTAFFHQPPSGYSMVGYGDMYGAPSSRAPTVAGSNYGDAADEGGPGSPQTPFTPGIGNGLFVDQSGPMNLSEGYEQVGASMGLSAHYSQRNSAVGLSNVSSDSSEYPDPNMSRRPSLASSSYSNFNGVPSTDSFPQWPLRSGEQTPALYGSQLSLYHENYDPNDQNGMYAMSGNVSDDENDMLYMKPTARRQIQIESQKATVARQQFELQQWANQRLTSYTNAASNNTMAVENLES